MAVLSRAMPSRAIPIADPADARIAAYADIRERDLVGHGRRFIVEGELVLQVFLSRSPLEAESVLILDSRLPRLLPLLAALPETVPVYSASRAVMDRIVGFPIHRGVLAVGRRGPERTHGALLDGLRAGGLAVGLIGISNHDNIGGIFRNAAAFAADAVLLDATSCDPLYRKAIRVSAGASLTVPFSRRGSADDMLRALAEADFDILALTPAGAEPLERVSLGPRTALLLGAEGEGLPDAILARTRTLRVPMAPEFDSLNVATASGIALHKVFCDRRPAGD